MEQVEFNYFNLFGLPIKFDIDQSLLKKAYYKLSREHHPDHVSAGSESNQDDITTKSSEINQAFATLSDESKRIKYILSLHHVMENPEQETLPQDFLMDVMEINETIFDLQMDYDELKKEKAIADVNTLMTQIKNEGIDAMYNFDNEKDVPESLEKIKNYYLKSKYLLRIKENIATFASL
jgi:molecular chaperone HscB